MAHMFHDFTSWIPKGKSGRTCGTSEQTIWTTNITSLKSDQVSHTSLFNMNCVDIQGVRDKTKYSEKIRMPCQWINDSLLRRYKRLSIKISDSQSFMLVSFVAFNWSGDLNIKLNSFCFKINRSRYCLSLPQRYLKRFPLVNYFLLFIV